MRIGNYSEFLTNLKQGINRMLFLHDILTKNPNPGLLRGGRGKRGEYS